VQQATMLNSGTNGARASSCPTVALRQTTAATLSPGELLPVVSFLSPLEQLRLREASSRFSVCVEELARDDALEWLARHASECASSTTTSVDDTSQAGLKPPALAPANYGFDVEGFAGHVSDAFKAAEWPPGMIRLPSAFVADTLLASRAATTGGAAAGSNNRLSGYSMSLATDRHGLELEHFVACIGGAPPCNWPAIVSALAGGLSAAVWPRYSPLLATAERWARESCSSVDGARVSFHDVDTEVDATMVHGLAVLRRLGKPDGWAWVVAQWLTSLGPLVSVGLAAAKAEADRPAWNVEEFGRRVVAHAYEPMHRRLLIGAKVEPSSLVPRFAVEIFCVGDRAQRDYSPDWCVPADAEKAPASVRALIHVGYGAPGQQVGQSMFSMNPVIRWMDLGGLGGQPEPGFEGSVAKWTAGSALARKFMVSIVPARAQLQVTHLTVPHIGVTALTHSCFTACPHLHRLGGLQRCSRLESIVGGCFAATSVVTLDLAQFPELHTLKSGAFQCMRALVRVRLSETMEVVEEAFDSCDRLRFVDFTPCVRLKRISRSFTSCTRLEAADLSSCAALAVVEGAFQRCLGLRTLKLPPAIQALDSHSFGGCTNIQHVEGQTESLRAILQSHPVLRT
jgi:hypothetical protein